MLPVASNRSVPSTGQVNLVDRPPIFPAISEAWRALRKRILDPYRPELHYMRGPGPKWREKHGAPHVTRSGGVVRTLRATRMNTNRAIRDAMVSTIPVTPA